MNRKTTLIAALLALVLTSLACGLNLQMPDDAIQVGPLETEEINIAPGGDGPVDVTLKFGTGKLYIQPGAAGAVIQGTSTYNVPELAPISSTSSNSITLEQGSLDFELGGLPNFSDLENTWDLQFSTRPMNLEIRAGAFLGEYELGGLALNDFRYIGGGAKVTLAFSTPNLVPMGEFKYTAGTPSGTIMCTLLKPASILTVASRCIAPLKSRVKSPPPQSMSIRLKLALASPVKL